jgi:hypothetical protein
MRQSIILRKVAGVFAALRRGYGMSMRLSSDGARASRRSPARSA